MRRRTKVVILAPVPLVFLAALFAGGVLCGRCWFTPKTPHYASGAAIEWPGNGRGLRTFLAAQVWFRAHDGDGNGVEDFWRADVAGLYVLPEGKPNKLIWLGDAAADDRPKADIGRYAIRGPAAGYWYRAIRHADEAAPDPKRFVICGYPADYPHGYRITAVLDESCRIWTKDLGRPGGIDIFPADPAAEGWKSVD